MSVNSFHELRRAPVPVAPIYRHAVWLNPLPGEHWQYTPPAGMIRQIFAGRMYPLTLEGIDVAMPSLSG